MESGRRWRIKTDLKWWNSRSGSGKPLTRSQYKPIILPRIFFHTIVYSLSLQHAGLVLFSIQWCLFSLCMLTYCTGGTVELALFEVPSRHRQQHAVAVAGALTVAGGVWIDLWRDLDDVSHCRVRSRWRTGRLFVQTSLCGWWFGPVAGKPWKVNPHMK